MTTLRNLMEASLRRVRSGTYPKDVFTAGLLTKMLLGDDNVSLGKTAWVVFCAETKTLKYLRSALSESDLQVGAACNASQESSLATTEFELGYLDVLLVDARGRGPAVRLPSWSEDLDVVLAFAYEVDHCHIDDIIRHQRINDRSGLPSEWRTRGLVRSPLQLPKELSIVPDRSTSADVWWCVASRRSIMTWTQWFMSQP